jgi:hypothetical protein
MALVFPRLAQNFIKNGYFPTDEDTLSRILGALDIGASRVRVFDPCCGEGSALAEIKQHLTECGASVTGYGVEFDAERAWHAKNLLDRVAHADVADVFVTARSVGLLFLNPPYGQVVADTAGTGDRAKGDRLEKLFLRRTLGWIQFGGVMVLIVPHYVLDTEFASLIARNFERVEVFMAPEQRFKQCVIFARKRRSDTPDPAIIKRLALVGSGTLPPVLPEGWTQEPYLIPQASEEGGFVFNSIRLDPAQLAVELQAMHASTLWPQFDKTFSSLARPHRRPLRDLSKWHLALALAAGQISGLVASRDGRQLLIKGDTHKEKSVRSEFDHAADGRVQETRIATDIFVPVIRGIDFTPGPSFGNIVTIR